jgi:two-component system, NtrC family, sensor kinase
MRWASRLVSTRSILSKLYILIIPIIVLTIAAVGYLDARMSSRMMDAEIEQSTQRMATQLAQDLSGRDSGSSPEIVRGLLLDLEQSNYFVARIDAYRLTGGGLERLATTAAIASQPITIDETAAVRESRTLTVHLYEDRERFVKVIVPISGPAGNTGCVSVLASLRESDIIADVHRKIGLVLVPTAIVVFVLLIHFLFTRVVTGRIARLITAMNQARAGDLAKRAAVENEDELGTISRRFNEMMVEIERGSLEREALLQEQRNFNTQLQQMIGDATQELSAANDRLRRSNQDLIETQHRLTQLERAAMVGQMAATFAHEIGSPLSAISTHLELMAEDSGTNEAMRRRLGLIRDQVTRITGFVEEMLAETRSASQFRSAVRINELLEQILLFMEQHLERHAIRIERTLDPEVPEIRANPQQLQQVFLNLLNNSCDAMPSGGTIRIETAVESDRQGKLVAVSVADTGTGIPEEKQARIFEPFFSTKDLRRGAGLGLGIAATIIRQHHGTIALQSAPGLGTKFTLRFPAAGSGTEEAVSGRKQ